MKLAWWKVNDSKIDDPIFQATAQALSMIDKGKEMFEIITDAIEKETTPEIANKIKNMDKELNTIQWGIRRRIYTHLSLTKCNDLFQSLVLLTIIIDTERIGDYAKNISDIVEAVPGKLDFHEYTEDYLDIKNKISKLFDLTKTAFMEMDKEKAKEAYDFYIPLGKKIDEMLKELVAQEGEKDCMKKDFLGLVLLLRYLKRVGAHLKNIATTVVNPFDRIGFQIQDEYLK